MKSFDALVEGLFSPKVSGGEKVPQISPDVASVAGGRKHTVLRAEYNLCNNPSVLAGLAATKALLETDTARVVKPEVKPTQPIVTVPLETHNPLLQHENYDDPDYVRALTDQARQIAAENETTPFDDFEGDALC